MWSYVGRLWSSSKPVTRLDQFEESAKFLSLLENLRTKTEALGAESLKEGSSQLVKEKFTILHSLVTSLNQSIDQFNGAPKPSYLDDLKAVVELVNHLRELVDEKLSGDALNILSLQQDGSNTTTAADLAVKAITAPLVTEVIPSLGAHYVFNPAKRKLKLWYGVDPEKTASVLLLEQLHDALVSVNMELNRKLYVQLSTIDLTTNSMQSPSASSGVVRCSLTGNEISDPVRCSLDNSIYEREALLDYLVQHGKSPVNEKPIPQNVPASAVMQEDEELKAFIAAQKQQRRSGMQPK